MGCSVQVLWAISEDDPIEYMSKNERETLKFVSFAKNINSRIVLAWLFL